jgi:hypothetical protein
MSAITVLKELFVLFNSCYKDVQMKVVMKSSVFWDITPCSPLKFNLCVGEACQFHVQGGRISKAKSHGEAGGKKNTGLGDISQNIEPYTTTAVRTSDPTMRIRWTRGVVHAEEIN